jgi:hypothetical protein
MELKSWASKLVQSRTPWRNLPVCSRNDPLFDDWQKAIAEYRRQVDKDPDYL